MLRYISANYKPCAPNILGEKLATNLEGLRLTVKLLLNASLGHIRGCLSAHTIHRTILHIHKQLARGWYMTSEVQTGHRNSQPRKLRFAQCLATYYKERSRSVLWLCGRLWSGNRARTQPMWMRLHIRVCWMLFFLIYRSNVYIVYTLMSGYSPRSRRIFWIVMGSNMRTQNNSAINYYCSIKSLHRGYCRDATSMSG